MSQQRSTSAGQCPVMHGGATSEAMANKTWWPNALTSTFFINTTVNPPPLTSTLIITPNSKRSISNP